MESYRYLLIFYGILIALPVFLYFYHERNRKVWHRGLGCGAGWCRDSVNPRVHTRRRCRRCRRWAAGTFGDGRCVMRVSLHCLIIWTLLFLSPSPLINPAFERRREIVVIASSPIHPQGICNGCTNPNDWGWAVLSSAGGDPPAPPSLWSSWRPYYIGKWMMFFGVMKKNYNQ